jgi:hypothetical protein
MTNVRSRASCKQLSIAARDRADLTLSRPPLRRDDVRLQLASRELLVQIHGRLALELARQFELMASLAGSWAELHFRPRSFARCGAGRYKVPFPSMMTWTLILPLRELRALWRKRRMVWAQEIAARPTRSQIGCYKNSQVSVTATKSDRRGHATRPRKAQMLFKAGLANESNQANGTTFATT